ncbi:DUF342 domain-containing protein [Fusibacter tunisiensis]|uniref:Uncharacterized protein (DUF342 family) n=1 Tax=Fusibacter tunisiensis TaxID=1008308 RepID=A0ABS2MMR4_9FIRM|nr:FapA family protein [Fusibacter tunisiensis]MBM7560612.1 uncharacterized protein (DUF342 family) [Fusibacter tunisiensis]
MSETSRKFEASVKISDNYYVAYLSLEMEPGAKVKPDDIIKILKERNVIFGLKHNVIEQICKEGTTVHSIVVAEGIVHENGKDGYIDFKITKEHKVKPQILEDGRVDFKNMGFVELVNEEDVLAVKVPPTKGKNGTTVTGKAIRGKDGKDVVLKIGKNMRVSPDGLKAIATSDGTVVVDNDRISVIKSLEIRGDVGVETGNITFQGQVVVNGNVTSGYSVECDGDLVVNGVVEGAVLKAGGNIVISRGIQGHDKASITCHGDLTSNFINSCHVYVKGTIETGAIMSSKIKCDGRIVVKGKKGLIVGGEITSKSDIEANVVGSELGVTTSIKLGVDVETIEELKTLTSDVRDLIDMHDKLGKSVKLLKTKIEQNPEDKRSVFMYEKYSANFVEMDVSLNEKRTRLKMLNELVNNISGAQIKANTFYPGTRIKVGNGNFYVKHQLTRSIIKKDHGEIIAIGF